MRSLHNIDFGAVCSGRAGAVPGRNRAVPGTGPRFRKTNTVSAVCIVGCCLV